MTMHFNFLQLLDRTLLYFFIQRWYVITLFLCQHYIVMC